MKQKIMTMLAVVLLNAMAGNALAQSQEQSPWVFKIDGGAAHQSEVDFKDQPGSFSVDRWFISAGLDYAWSRRDSIGVSIGGGRSDYDFGTTINDFTPWSEIENSRVSLTGRFGFGETGSVFIIPSVRLNKEKGASSSDSRSYGLLAAAAWRINPDLTIGPGLGVFSKLEDGTRIFPILAIDWNISERWNLSTGRGLAASQGPGLTLGYKLNPNWSFGLSGRYEDVEFRLDNTGSAPGGIGRDRSIPLILSARLAPNKTLSFSVFAGVELGGSLELRDALDRQLEETDYDPAPIFGASFDLRF